MNGEIVKRERLKRFLRIYQTSSPSYLFLAAMEEAIEITNGRAEALFGTFLQNFTKMCDTLRTCKHLYFLQEPGMDIGKLVIADKSNTFSGQQLYDKLLHQYHLQSEMAAGKYVLLMFTVGDTKEGYERLAKALLEIDNVCSKNVNMHLSENVNDRMWASDNREVSVLPQVKYPLWKSWGQTTEEVTIDRVPGYVAGEFINLYPPGIPILAPGEKITKDILEYIRYAKEKGCSMTGPEDPELEHLNVLAEVTNKTY
mgnify:CR=1 FL=1